MQSKTEPAASVDLRPLSYAQMLKLPGVASGLIPDGYCGHMAEVLWRFDAESGKTLANWEKGFFVAPLPLAADIAESEWLVRNHPNAREWIVRAGSPD